MLTLSGSVAYMSGRLVHLQVLNPRWACELRISIRNVHKKKAEPK